MLLWRGAWVQRSKNNWEADFLFVSADLWCSQLQHCSQRVEIARKRVSQSRWSASKRHNLNAWSSRFENVTQLSFRFGDEYFRPMRRKLRYTIIDFLSYVGGLLGLFAGISVLSFFELFYFYVLRILSNIFVKKEAERQSVLIVRPAKWKSKRSE